MPTRSTIDPGPSPNRDGSRDGSAPPPPRRQPCPVCRAPLTSTRARYCSHACKQRAYRLRQLPTAAADLAPLTAELARRGDRLAHTVYECPLCAQRFLGERRCSDCNRFCRALGPGGACLSCDEPILIADLIGTEVTTTS